MTARRAGLVVAGTTLVAVAAVAVAALVGSRWGRPGHHAVHASRLGRNTRLARLGARVGTTYATTAARKTFASAERRDELDRHRELRSAQQVADELGQMKGALMKLGQMASYLDDGLPEPLRLALSQLQSNAPPMSVELSIATVERELGRSIDDAFVEFDPDPIAAASIGQVHRAIIADADGRERAVAVKVQYPGVADAIVADLRNADLLDGRPDPLLRALPQLQSDAPPMSVELGLQTIEGELGRPVDEVFVEFDPNPIAAASIGQVLSLIHISEPTRRACRSRMPSSA